MNKTLKKQLITNLILISVIASLALIIILKPGKDETNPLILSELNKADINTITINIPNKRDITITRNNNHWQLTEPFVIDANQFRIETLLNIVNNKSQKQYDASNLDLSEFGLQSAQATLTLNDTRIQFGNIEQIHEQRYILIGNTLSLIDDTHFPMVYAGLNNFAAVTPLPAKEKPIAFQLPTFKLTQDAAEQWTILPKDDSLSADDIHNWLQQWQLTQAVYVEHKSLTPKQSEPVITITLDNRTIEFIVIANEEQTGLYRADIKLWYTLTEQTLNNLLTKPNSSNTEEN